MSGDKRLKIVFCWHMHQPVYRDAISGEYQLPWTYLHAIKDYVDMAAYLERSPAARAVVNFAPVLLEQIDDYARQVTAWLDDGQPIGDALLAALADGTPPAGSDARRQLLRACLRANRERMIDRFPWFSRLADLAENAADDDTLALYLSDQYVTDLVVWYHLAWLGETVRRSDARVTALLEKEHDYTPADRRVLVTVLGELLSGVLGRYAALARSGQIELAMSPYAHPIVPLLLDLESTRQAMPDAELPLAPAYPGGEERAVWHLREGRATFKRLLGIEPQGCWPSEGSVSDATMALLGENGFRWAASGEGVLRNSLAAAGQTVGEAWKEGAHAGEGICTIHQPFRVGEQSASCFFRDDGLSDLIGFTYATWHADDAVADLVTHLENIAAVCPEPENQVVSIILDGENAWEYYPENAWYFLGPLYQKLSAHPLLEMTTFSDALDDAVPVIPLPGLVAGSWVYGSFSTWIGSADKNRGWDLLVAAKQAFDRVAAAGSLQGKALADAERQLAVCEGSDWFWWFGDYNPAGSVADFEKLFRHHLTRLYDLIGEPVPDELTAVISVGQGKPATGGVMRPGSAS